MSTSLLQLFFGYALLTKPTIMLLVLLSGATALILEGSFLDHPGKFALFLIGLYLTGGAANAFNQYFERDIDARMTRTMKRRPLPTGTLQPRPALVFSIIIGTGGVILLAQVFNILTAALAAGTMLFYGLFYTLWLKPNTPHNIVIGGVAGAMAPIGAWAAATGEIAAVPVIMFLIVFFWTPPHFWSLALCFADDYRKTGLPMMPVIGGVRATLRQSFYYSLALIGVSLTYVMFGGGWLYLLAAIGLGAAFIRKIMKARKGNDPRLIRGVFSFSIVYLFGLFLAMIADRFIGRLIG